MFTKIIDPLWKKYDTEGKGYITQQQFLDLAKQALAKASHADKYDEKKFQKACKLMTKGDKTNPEGNITKRQVAELLNNMVFGGL